MHNEIKIRKIDIKSQYVPENVLQKNVSYTKVATLTYDAQCTLR